MKALKLYHETTIFNWYFEPDREYYPATRQLFQEISEGKFEAYASDYVIEELARAEETKRQMMVDLLGKSRIGVLKKSEEADKLAEQYAMNDMISEKHRYDR